MALKICDGDQLDLENLTKYHCGLCFASRISPGSSVTLVIIQFV